MKANINSTLLRKLPEGQDVDIYDSKLTGFVLRLRASGRHAYRVQLGRGKWVHLGRITDLTPAEAREQAQAALGDKAKGIDVVARRKREKVSNLRDFVRDIYAPWISAQRKTGEAAVRTLNRFTDLSGTKLGDITPWQIEKWRTKKMKEGTKPATINRDLGTLQAALNRAVEWGYLDANPLSKMKRTKTDDLGRPRFLSEDEEIRLRDALDAREERHREARESANAWRKERDYPLMPDLRALPFVDHLKPIVLLALNTGLRRGELFNLKWQDVDLERATLTVQGSGAKSGKTRHLPLNAEALDTFKGWQATRSGAGLVFPGDEGERLDNIDHGWQRLCKDAQLVAFRFHDLRHTFASKLVMAGVDLNTVRELLGHSDIKMTLRYAHLAPEHKAAAVARLSAPARVREATA
jgi:integrase